MFLAIDIGNTMISVAIVSKRESVIASPFKIEGYHQIPTQLSSNILQQRVKSLFQKLIVRNPRRRVILCSVVPEISKAIQEIFRKDFNIKPMVVGKDFIVPIKNHYRNPRQVGQDRLVCGYAAKMIYKEPLIVIDFGTAITFDVIAPTGAYMGGIIVPGIRLTAESLFKKTAMLPKVKIKVPRELIGRDTSSSILSGIFYGYGALADGLIKLIARRMQCTPKVVLTGGYCQLMQRFIFHKVFSVDQYLVFKGMALLGQEYFESKVMD